MALTRKVNNIIIIEICSCGSYSDRLAHGSYSDTLWLMHVFALPHAAVMNSGLLDLPGYQPF